MEKFIFMGRYSIESLKEMSIERTEKAINLINELGGKVENIYALLGNYDLIIIAQIPDTEKAMKASLGLAILTGISFSTCPAISVKDFDKIVGEPT
ncbi:MAG: GYD domain-containing protein [Candidatus Omnitrophica bacterium]|nr:GYD domain-containing protein [Candidatus Omnitrophota bacterium]